jgi:hypothetical protein
MDSASLNGYIALAQILVPIIALVGIVVSMWLSVKALREVQIDRKLRQMPHLAFDYGGHRLPIEFRKAGRSVLGIDHGYAEKLFHDQPKDAESINLKTEPIEGGRRKVILQYGRLRNYGLGTAFSAEVTWIAKKVRIGSEEFDIDSKKLLEPQYSKELNCIPSSPSHILPGEVAEFFRLPTFINKDFERKISEVEGILLIECEDLYGGKHITNQEFFLFTYYGSESPAIHITFSDLIKNQ